MHVRVRDHEEANSDSYEYGACPASERTINVPHKYAPDETPNTDAEKPKPNGVSQELSNGLVGHHGREVSIR